jgi:hypothetical protein
MQTKDGGLANHYVDVAGPLLNGCLEKFVNQNRCHGRVPSVKSDEGILGLDE